MNGWRTQFRTFLWFTQWWQRDLTSTGKAVLASFLCCLPGIANPDSALFLFGLANLALLVVAIVASRVIRPQLQVRMHLPASARRLEAVECLVDLENRGRFTACDLRLAPHASEVHWELVSLSPVIADLQPGGRARLRVLIRSLNRGVLQYPRLECVSAFPLHLLRARTVVGTRGQIVVGPDYRGLRSTPLIAQAARVSGLHRPQRAASGSAGDYAGSRDYVPGLPVRRWDYSSWARLGQPAVREFEEPHRPCVLIVVDAHRVADDSESGNEFHRLHEAALSLAAALADSLLAADCHIKVVLPDGDPGLPSFDTPTDPFHDILVPLARARGTTADESESLSQRLGNLADRIDVGFLIGLGPGHAGRRLWSRLKGLCLSTTRLLVVDHEIRAASAGGFDRLVTIRDIETGEVDL